MLAAAGFAALLVASCMGAPPAPEGPWCLVADQGGGNVTSDCTLPSFEACNREALSGNRGMCNRNPRWNGPT
jgi:hypothetical protein